MRWCLFITQYDVADHFSRHFGAVRRAKKEVPETEDKKKLAEDDKGNFDTKLGIAGRDVAEGHLFECYERMHIDRVILE